MEAFAKEFVGQVNNLSPWVVYITFFISAVLQLTFPPYPGDTILIAGGYLGIMGISGGGIPIFLSYWLGTLLSTFALYGLGSWKGENLLKNKFIKKYFPEKNQEKARGWVFKYGMIAFLLCKFIPGLNSLIVFFGGVFRYNKALAFLGLGAASTIHNIMFFLAGRAIGDNYEHIARFLSIYNKTVFVLVGLGLATYLIYQLKKMQNNRA